MKVLSSEWWESKLSFSSATEVSFELGQAAYSHFPTLVINFLVYFVVAALLVAEEEKAGHRGFLSGL